MDCANETRPTIKDVVCLLVAALASLAVCLMLSAYGAQGRLGFFAVYAGYPGGFINWKLNPGRVSYALIALVNTGVYFGILEVLALLVAKRPSNAGEHG